MIRVQRVCERYKVSALSALGRHGGGAELLRRAVCCPNVDLGDGGKGDVGGGARVGSGGAGRRRGVCRRWGDSLVVEAGGVRVLKGRIRLVPARPGWRAWRGMAKWWEEIICWTGPTCVGLLAGRHKGRRVFGRAGLAHQTFLS